VHLSDLEDLQTLYALSIEIEDVQPAGGSRSAYSPSFNPAIATIYINHAQSEALSEAGLAQVPIPNEGYRSFLAYGPGSGAVNAWPTFEQYVARMQALEAAHPDIVRLVSIGTSVEERNLWCMKITDNLNADEFEPEFKYSANHHGDETTGVEMTMRLAELLADGYGIDPGLTDLVDKMEIWLCPIYNPDGYVHGTRYNANGYDLNRNYPDRFTGDPAYPQPETLAYMNFSQSHRFSMGANYHGGAQVLNYPWDAVAAPGDPEIPAYAPDDQLFFDFGLGYTSRNSYLWNGGWPYGMTRGWEWYQIWGGMQDWAYFYQDEHHVTLEISDIKSPPYTQMDLHWDENRDAMLWWMQKAWTGLAGMVLDARDDTPLDATLTLVGREAPNTIRTDPQAGDYHRVISEGTYSLNASASGYQSQVKDAVVISGTLTTLDFYLCPQDAYTVSGTVTDAYTSLPLEATVEFLGSRQVVNSDPVTGDYTIDVCPSTYTMRVSAPWYATEERVVEIDHNQVQDFALVPLSNLSPSEKVASAGQPVPEDVVQYQLFVNNAVGTASVTVTDTLPISVTWTGHLTATQGVPTYDSGKILWQGEVSHSQPVTITYEVSVNQCLPIGTVLLNLAEFNDGVNGAITRKVQLDVANASPTLPSSPTPTDGAGQQPVTTTLSWAASSDLNCDPITYDLYFGTSPTPPLVESDLTSPVYDPGALELGMYYYWYVVASDGLTQVTGPTWMFSTAGNRIFLPLAIK